MNLIPDTLHEVLVRDLSISVFVEERKDRVHLILVNREAPVVEEFEQLTFVDEFIVILIKVLKGFAHSAPLLSDLVDKLA